MPSLIKKLSGRVPSLPRIPEPSDSSEDDPILQRLGMDRNRIAWSGENTFSVIPNAQNGPTEPVHNEGSQSTARGILRNPAGRGQGGAAASAGALSGPSPKTPVSTRPRYNRTPVRMTVAGDWALKECEVIQSYIYTSLNMAMLILTKNFGVHVGGRERERRGRYYDFSVFASTDQKTQFLPHRLFVTI